MEGKKRSVVTQWLHDNSAVLQAIVALIAIAGFVSTLLAIAYTYVSPYFSYILTVAVVILGYYSHFQTWSTVNRAQGLVTRVIYPLLIVPVIAFTVGFAVITLDGKVYRLEHNDQPDGWVAFTRSTYATLAVALSWLGAMWLSRQYWEHVVERGILWGRIQHPDKSYDDLRAAYLLSLESQYCLTGYWILKYVVPADIKFLQQHNSGK
jgi:hypothetical protein